MEKKQNTAAEKIDYCMQCFYYQFYPFTVSLQNMQGKQI